MSRYVVIGGFLGAGKTTSMMAFADVLKKQGKIPAILVNDLGAKNLVDGSYTASGGYLSLDITGECICYQTENLVDRLRRFRDREHADIVFSDIPGCGIGALDHVYHKLNRDYPGEFTLCPFTAVADPERLRVIMPEHADIHLPGEMEYLFDAQMREAELIILNKTDLLTEQRREEILSYLRSTYPQAAVFGMSAATGEGVPEVVDYLMSHESALPVAEIGYGGPEFAAAEKIMSWYNRQFFVKCGNAFDTEAFSARLMDNIRDGLRAIGRNVPHLKMMGETAEGEMLKISLLGVDYPLQHDAEAEHRDSRSLKVILNARAVCESERLEEICDTALREAAEQFGLSLRVYFTECFGMMDEGR